jgi:hypothetical protein
MEFTDTQTSQKQHGVVILQKGVKRQKALGVRARNEKMTWTKHCHRVFASEAFDKHHKNSIKSSSFSGCLTTLINFPLLDRKITCR